MSEQTKDLESALHTYRKAWEAEKEKVTQLEAERENEKEIRIRYQEIVYEVCRVIDKATGRTRAGTRLTIHEVVDAVKELAALSEQEEKDVT